MKTLKKLAAATAFIFALGVGVTAYAGTLSPSQIVSKLTGKTIEQVESERQKGKTYGTIAKENGKLDQFKAEMLVEKKATLDQLVKDKKITQQQADAIYNTMKTNQATCDGTGNGTMRNALGRGMGMGNGTGCTLNNGTGNGTGAFHGGKGMGRGFRVNGTSN